MLTAKRADRIMTGQNHCISVSSFLCGGDAVAKKLSGETAASPFALGAPKLCRSAGSCAVGAGVTRSSFPIRALREIRGCSR